jgi:hypothetical protein
MSKLRYYITFKQKIQKKYFLSKNLKNHILGGLGVEKPQKNPEYAKIRVLPTLGAKKSKKGNF